MKIKIEGYFSRLATDLIHDDEESASMSAAKPKNTRQIDNASLMKRFRDYVNHSRSPFQINSENHFSGRYDALKKFASSFEKVAKGCKVYISKKYIEGEEIPVVDKITYNGGEQ